MSRLPRPKAITLTDAAAEHIQGIIASSDKELLGLKLGVENAGCAGMAYTLEYAEEKGAHDELVEDKGVTVLIDSKALLFLLGTEMDYEVTKMHSGFVFNNPNQTDACGCGESVNLVAAQNPFFAAPDAETKPQN